jgi:hypothetical protein
MQDLLRAARDTVDSMATNGRGPVSPRMMAQMGVAYLMTNEFSRFRPTLLHYWGGGYEAILASNKGVEELDHGLHIDFEVAVAPALQRISLKARRALRLARLGERLVFYFRKFADNKASERAAIIVSAPGAPRLDTSDPQLGTLLRLDAEPRVMHLNLPDRVQISVHNLTPSIRVIEHRNGNVSFQTFGSYHQQLEAELLGLAAWTDGSI